MRLSRIALPAGSVVLFAAAAVLSFSIEPGLHKVPSDQDSTSNYVGTATLLNAPAIATGDIQNLFLKDLPVKASQRMKAVKTSGSTVVLQETDILTGPDGKDLQNSQYTYAVDSKTLAGRPAPAGTKATTIQGSLGPEVTPKKSGYQMWDSTTQQAFPATYVRTEKREGRTTYVYNSKGTAPVKDPTTLASMPQSLPKTALKLVAAALPADQQKLLAGALPQLPDPLPLTYLNTLDVTLWVDAATGNTLDTTKDQTIVAAMPGASAPTPLAAVTSVKIKVAPEQVKKNAAAAADDAKALTLIGTVIPIALTVVGLALLALAFWLPRRRRGATPEETPVEETATV
ncbi:porin PorA family protein [Actinocorallia longicatena]|uniref:DUF3068 domain-containing protein n=1 Tax=Actinocorallia longicatena TaxID=111803 RepID=A0ABP6QH86_9ACTN